MRRNRTLSAIMVSVALTLAASFATAKPTGQTKQESKRTERREGQEEKDEESRDQSKLAREAKITMDAARETAIKRAPGNVESGELEREHGRLVYSFDIRNAKGTITEVQVSAITGKVVRVEHENKKQEENEKQQEDRERERGTKKP